MPSNVRRASPAIFARVERSNSSVCVKVTSMPIIGPPIDWVNNGLHRSLRCLAGGVIARSGHLARGPERGDRVDDRTGALEVWRMTAREDQLVGRTAHEGRDRLDVREAA